MPGEKVLPASPRRRQKAQEEGQRQGATTLPGVLGLLCAVLVLGTGARGAARTIEVFSAEAWSGSVSMASVTSALRAAIMPFLLAAAGVPLAVAVALSVRSISLLALAPRFQALLPTNSIARTFSADAAATLLRGVLAAAFVGIAVLSPVLSLIHATPALIGNPQGALAVAARDVFGAVVRGAIAMLAVAGAEWLFRRWSHERDLKMSVQEMRDERRESEGDPMIRARRRRMHRALLQRRQLLDVPKATTVIANPEHYAIALRYRHGLDFAPVVLAMGRDAFALRIREVAFAAGVPIREDPPLARAMYPLCKLGRPVPEGLYVAVAAVIAWAQSAAG